jgi:uncharacterized protein YggE
MKYFSVIVLMAFAGFVGAQTGLPAERHVVVTGKAKLEAKPDIAVLHLALTSNQRESAQAKTDVDDRVNAFLAGLPDFDITNDNVSASSISTRADYDYINNKRRLVGYIANRSLKVTLKDLDKLNALMDFALSVKVNQINKIEFKSSKAEALEKEVTALAVKDAKEAGQSLAKAFDTNLGRVYSINSTTFENYDRYGANRDVETISVSGMRMEESEPGQYLQENIVFSASIKAVFILEDFF